MHLVYRPKKKKKKNIWNAILWPKNKSSTSYKKTLSEKSPFENDVEKE